MGASYQEYLDTPVAVIYRDIEMMHTENKYRQPPKRKATEKRVR